MRKLVFILSLLFSFSLTAQELNCDIVVNAQQTVTKMCKYLKTLEKQLKEFINNTQWTNRKTLAQERINCSMVITITDYDSDVFKGSIQISSSRPVFELNV